MTVLVVLGLVVLLAVIALAMDLRDRRHGRKSHVHLAGWLQRSGQASVARSPEGYLSDLEGVGSTYSAEQLREPDEDEPPTD